MGTVRNFFVFLYCSCNVLTSNAVVIIKLPLSSRSIRRSKQPTTKVFLGKKQLAEVRYFSKTYILLLILYQKLLWEQAFNAPTLFLVTTTHISLFSDLVKYIFNGYINRSRPSLKVQNFTVIFFEKYYVTFEKTFDVSTSTWWLENVQIIDNRREIITKKG